MPRPTHRQPPAPRIRDRRLGKTAQYFTRPHQITTEKARAKMGRAYPKPSAKES
jgi:hypothetical protein